MMIYSATFALGYQQYEQPTYYFQFCYNLQFSTLRNLHLKTTKGDDYDMMDPDFRVKNHLCS